MGKSQIKEIFRELPLSVGRILCDLQYSNFAHRGTIRTAITDASVLFASGGSGTVLEFVDRFRAAAARSFTAHEALHTFIFVFDKKLRVPVEKRVVQAARRESLQASADRRNVALWAWDGTSPVLQAGMGMPPWERVRLTPKATNRALADTIDLLCSSLTPPPGCRIVIDEERGIQVIESDQAGTVMPPYVDARFHNELGEADLAMQLLALRARAGHLGAKPGIRPEFAAGDVLLTTVDTDFLTLVPLHLAAAPHNVFLELGPIALDDTGKVRPRATPDTVVHRELFDGRKLADAIAQLHPALPSDAALACFAAFSASMENDYVSKLFGTNHQRSFKAFRASPPFAAIGDEGALEFDAARFMDYIYRAYFLRLSAKARESVYSRIEQDRAQLRASCEEHRCSPVFTEEQQESLALLAQQQDLPLLLLGGAPRPIILSEGQEQRVGQLPEEAQQAISLFLAREPRTDRAVIREYVAKSYKDTRAHVPPEAQLLEFLQSIKWSVNYCRAIELAPTRDDRAGKRAIEHEDNRDVRAQAVLDLEGREARLTDLVETHERSKILEWGDED